MYYTVKVTKDTNGEVTRDCRSFDSVDDAKIRFHSDLSSNIGKEGIAYIMCDLLDEEGIVVMNEVWRAPTE